MRRQACLIASNVINLHAKAPACTLALAPTTVYSHIIVLHIGVTEGMVLNQPDKLVEKSLHNSIRGCDEGL